MVAVLLPQEPRQEVAGYHLILLPFCSCRADSLLFTDYNTALCIIPKDDQDAVSMSEASEIKLDGREVNVTHGPSSLEKWMFSKYPAMWEKIDRRINPSKYHQVTDVDLLLVR